jgi:hypothetical protein
VGGYVVGKYVGSLVVGGEVGVGVGNGVGGSVGVGVGTNDGSSVDVGTSVVG